MPGAAGGGPERQQAEHRDSALPCNVNGPHPRAPGKARRAPACPRRHSSTQVAALGGAYLPPGQLLLALAEPRYNRQRLPSSALQGQETPGLRCCFSESAAPQGRGPSLCSSSRPGAHAQLRNRPAPAPRYPSCAPAEAAAMQGLPMLWEQSRPPAGHCQQHRFSRGNHLLLQLTSTASPHTCPGHHTLFAPSTKSEYFDTQPGRTGRLLGSTSRAGAFLGCSWG